MRAPITKQLAAIASVALIAIVLSPLARSPTDDGFPLSTYPMFASPRKTLQTIDYAYGETATGERRTLAPAVLGTGEVLQAVTMIARAVHQGKPATDALCARIAERVALDSRFADVAVVHVVTGTHDAVDYLVRGVQGHELERARCAVVRP